MPPSHQVCPGGMTTEVNVAVRSSGEAVYEQFPTENNEEVSQHMLESVSSLDGVPSLGVKDDDLWRAMKAMIVEQFPVYMKAMLDKQLPVYIKPVLKSKVDDMTVKIDGTDKSAGDEYSEAMHTGDVSVDCDSVDNVDAGAVVQQLSELVSLDKNIQSTQRVKCGVQHIPTNCLLDEVADKREEGLLGSISPDECCERGGLIFSYQGYCNRVGISEELYRTDEQSLVFDGGGGCQGVNIGFVWESSTNDFVKY